MFHLFDRIYLEYDHKLDVQEDRVVLSPRWAIPIEPSMTPIPGLGELFLEEAEPERFQLAEFVTLLSKFSRRDRRVLIYCDPPTYLRLASYWLRGLFPALSAEEFEYFWVLQLYKDHAVSPGGEQERRFWQTDALAETWRSTLPDADIKALRKLQRSLWGRCSLEYHLADYLNSGNWGTLARSVRLFIERNVSLFFTELRRDLRIQLWAARHQQVFGYHSEELRTLTPDTDPFTLFRTTRFLSNPRYWDEGDVPRLEGLGAEGLADLRHDLTLIAEGFEPVDSKVLDFQLAFAEIAVKTVNEITQSDVERFITRLREHTMDEHLITFMDLENINEVFIHYLLNSPESVIAEYRPWMT